jgi:hypothetical protein
MPSILSPNPQPKILVELTLLLSQDKQQAPKELRVLDKYENTKHDRDA